MKSPESRAIAGAGVLAAGASMPLHLLPILVLALISDGRLDASHAGWVGSAFMLGQLCVTLVLPLARVTQIRWRTACATMVAVVGCALLSQSRHAAVLLASWFAIGCLGGVLHYLATTTAAASEDRRFAFALRMAASSALGSCLILGLQLFRPQADYASVIGLYVILTALVGGVGLALFGATTTPSPRAPIDVAPPLASAGASPVLIAGLAVLFFMFVGQHGLWAFAVKGASQRGLPVSQLLWAVALCKMAGAAMVFATARMGLGSPGASLRWPGAAVAFGGAVVAFASSIAFYWIGLLLWEIGLNILSARLQAALAQQDARRAGMWITATIFLGAATGPVVAGMALGLGAFSLFAAFAAVTALAPSVWATRASAVAPALAIKRAA